MKTKIYLIETINTTKNTTDCGKVKFLECLRLFIERFNRISQTWRNITICDLWNAKNLSIQPLISCINCVHFILIFFYIYFHFSIYSQFWSILNIFHLLFIRIIIQKENSKEISKFHRTIYVFTSTYFNFMTIIKDINMFQS